MEDIELLLADFMIASEEAGAIEVEEEVEKRTAKDTNLRPLKTQEKL